jgi:Uri superfamily endonuclease
MSEINKYHHSKVYKIVDISNNKIYIGSTTNSLNTRLKQHIKDSKSNKFISSQLIIDQCGADNIRIELIQDVKCENRKELCKIEGEYIRKLDCVNKNVAGRSLKEYREEEKETLLLKNREYIKNYYHQNKAKFMKCKYYNGKIFKIYNKDKNIFYIGCTFDKLEDRFEYLMKKSKTSTIPALCCINALSGDWKIELIVQSNFKNNDEMYQLESIWIKSYENDCLNYRHKYEGVDVSAYLDGRLDESLLPEVFKGQKKV